MNERKEKAPQSGAFSFFISHLIFMQSSREWDNGRFKQQLRLKHGREDETLEFDPKTIG